MPTSLQDINDIIYNGKTDNSKINLLGEERKSGKIEMECPKCGRALELKHLSLNDVLLMCSSNQGLANSK
jgi:hypothetical protein